VTPYWRSLIAKETAEKIQLLKDNGCIFSDTQYAAFRKAVNPVYATIQQKMGTDLIERVSRVANPGT
jgi:TRAP-type C4-dicarboxylate transport system substrate-binding protein